MRDDEHRDGVEDLLVFPLRCDLPDSLKMNRSNIFFIFPRCTCAILYKRSESPLPRHIMAHR